MSDMKEVASATLEDVIASTQQRLREVGHGH